MDYTIGPVKKCVGCGFCCMQAPCAASVRLYPGAKICPQLIWDEALERYLCGLMQLPGSVGLAYKQELYAGAGCCSNLNSWRRNVKNRHPVDKKDKLLTIDPMFQLFLNCLGREWISSDVLVLTVSAFMLKLVNHMDMTEDEAQRYGELVTHYMKDNTPSYLKEFMG